MKGIKVFTLIAFFAIIAVPIALFNFKTGAVSEVDNHKLADSPFSASADTSKRWTVRTEEYINDRIGLRDQMTLGYNFINKYAFHMVPDKSYVYGKDSYIFSAKSASAPDDGDFEKSFTDMLKSMQTYCQQREIPFAVVIDPSKPSVLSDKAPSSIKYSNKGTTELINKLKANGVNVVDNVAELQKLKTEGKQVFNKEYDPDYWNATGAFYGVQNCLKNLRTTLTSVHLNEWKDFTIGQKTEKYLTDSRFPVNEEVPEYKLVTPAVEIKGYEGIRIDKDHNTFRYYVNEKRKTEGCPKALVFQGGYMNNYGYQFFQNSFGEYIMIDSSQNALNMPYYVSLFKPDCVVFEVAEYDINKKNFSSSKMKGLKFNTPLSSLDMSTANERSLAFDEIDITKSGEVTTIEFKTKEKFDNVWITFENDYDMIKSDKGYYAAVPTKEKDKLDVKMKVITQKDGKITIYS